jgi:hydroxyquinol 1,2-dioxygenase
MDGPNERPQWDDRKVVSLNLAEEFARRLSAASPTRLSATAEAAVGGLHALVAALRPTGDEFRAAIDFLTEVGHYADARRQEWVLLADVLGVSSLIEDLNHPRPAGATPNTVAGPFYRADVPETQLGANISRDGKGEPLAVAGRVTGLDGEGVAGAIVEVWHANADGLYENQEPDRQPEFNLRGRFRADGQGRFHFATVKPKGYLLPADGPVARLVTALGLSLARPAHIHFRVSAPGFETLTTHIFDADDPAIAGDAIFGVKPDLVAEFRVQPPGRGARRYALDLTLVLCPARPGGTDTSGRR